MIEMAKKEEMHQYASFVGPLPKKIQIDGKVNTVSSLAAEEEHKENNLQVIK